MRRIGGFSSVCAAAASGLVVKAFDSGKGYIGFSAAIVAAAFEEVDCTPMEGFDPAVVDRILNLGERGLRSAVMLPLGYRKAEQDWLVDLPKVRRPLGQLVSEID